MKPSFFPLLSFLALSSAFPRIRKREVCTVESFNNSLVDDVPTIAAALKKCGDGERILLSKDTTYTIRSPLDLSPCKACDFQINGLLKISHDWDYWAKQTAVFKIPNMTAAIIRSDGNTGIIDTQSLGLADPSTIAAAQIPKLFSISDKSYQIHVRDLKIKNVPGTAFYVHSDSTAVRFYGIEFENAATTGYLVYQAQHVYLWNNTIRASSTCVAVLPNSTNIQIEESTCITTGSSATSFGIELRLLASTGLGWIRNVFVKKVKAVGGMNVIAFSAGRGGGGPHTIEITNATFTNITIEGPAERAVYLQQDETVLNATKVTFENFQGEAEKESPLACVNTEDVCEFKTEGWNMVTRS